MKKTFVLFSILLMSALMAPSESVAWSRRGHVIVAQGAYEMLTAKQQEVLITIFSAADVSQGAFKRKVENPVTVDDASFWMDAVRHNYPEYKYMDNYHFTNIDDRMPDDIQFAITTAMAELKRSKISAQDRKLQYLMLLHLIADIHQPLHCGYKSDYGGNNVKLTCDDCLKGGATNLHRIWDDDLITYNKLSVATVRNAIKEMDVTRVASAQVDTWRKESEEIVANKKCYPVGTSVPTSYLVLYGKVAEAQLAKATIRLHWVLNQLLST